MFRRRRNFTRFGSRFKRRRRSPYPHQGGRYQRCQFTFSSNMISTDGASYVIWFDMLGISGHIADYSTPDRYVLTQIARYIEVRAVQWDATFQLFSGDASTQSLVVGIDWLFAGLCVDRDDAVGLPTSSGFFDPFTTESPVAAFPPSIATAQTDTGSPLRWMRQKYFHAQAGNLQNVSSTFNSSGYHGRWSSRYRRTIRLDDTTGLYWVAGRNSLLASSSVLANLTCSGSLWYRVGFGK